MCIYLLFECPPIGNCMDFCVCKICNTPTDVFVDYIAFLASRYTFRFLLCIVVTRYPKKVIFISTFCVSNVFSPEYSTMFSVIHLSFLILKNCENHLILILNF